MTGRTYLEHGQPVTILTRWATPHPPPCPPWLTWAAPPGRAPRNVLIRRTNGQLVVRPFRGLRKEAR